MADRAYLERLTRQLADDGRLIEAGWVGLRLAAIPLDAPLIQLDEMHKAYMAGAQHLWASIMTMLDAGAEPTEGDMRKMSLIAAELDAFADKLMADVPTAGRG
ncbi:MAG TPA: hypothetical protein VD863_07005 [Bradyrhizobium sp.]|nr:hypothetical protein [Bradyrhizobium sp.]